MPNIYGPPHEMELCWFVSKEKRTRFRKVLSNAAIETEKQLKEGQTRAHLWWLDHPGRAVEGGN